MAGRNDDQGLPREPPGRIDCRGRNSYRAGVKARTTVSEKGQITIPKVLRERLGMKLGQVLELEEDNGRILVTKADETDPVERLYGILPADPTTDAFIASIRGDPDAV
jgi:antitoxin PrlF